MVWQSMKHGQFAQIFTQQGLSDFLDYNLAGVCAASGHDCHQRRMMHTGAL